MKFHVSLAAPDVQANGEPDWLPSAEEVARARSDLARRGVLAALQRGATAADLVEPGETPWSWLIAAGLWIIVWPAVIALRLGQGWWAAWLPAWVPLAAAALHMLALTGPVLLALRDTSRSALRRRFGRVHSLAQMMALDPVEFETWIGMMFELTGFRVRNTPHTGDHGVDIEVSRPPINTGLVQCKRYRGTVGEGVVRELYGTLIHERADRAWLATTGAISRNAREWVAGKPIELWDGQKLVELARKLK